MSGIDSNWLVKFEENGVVRWLEPSRVRVRERMDAASIAPRLMAWMDPSLKGRKVLFKAQSTDEKFSLGTVSDEEDFCGIWLEEENHKQGFLSFNVLFSVYDNNNMKRYLPLNSLMKVDVSDRPVVSLTLLTCLTLSLTKFRSLQRA